MAIRTERTRRLLALAESAEIGCEKGVAISEPLHHQFPGEPGLGPAVQQE